MRYVLSLTLIFSLVVSDAYAEIYRWVDGKGKVHYTAVPPPESAIYDRHILDKQGQVKDVVRGKISDEEKSEIARKKAEEAARKKAELAARRRDNALLASYSSVEDIIARRDSRVASLDKKIKTLEADSEEAEIEYNKLLQNMVQIERSGKAPSEKMKAELRSAKYAYTSAKDALTKAHSDREKTLTTSEADIKRFRALLQ